MTKTTKSSVLFLSQSALIAALYLVLTLVSASMNLAYGPVQFRLSEALTILPVFTPAAIPGLAIGCFISNLASPLGVVDWVFGTGATLLAALLSYALRNIKVKKMPVLSFLPPIIINAVVIGIEIAGLSGAGFSFDTMNFEAFLAGAVSVGLGQFAVILILGTAFYIIIDKNANLKKLLR